MKPLLAVALTALVPACSAGQPAPPERPNVLLILTDQHNRRALGCMGSEPVLTPNLDRLAAGGALFRRAYCNTPLCGPSRYSLMSGLYSTELGAFANSVAPRPGFEYLPEYLNALGYDTGNAGKTHFYPRDAVHGFQHYHAHEGYFSRLRSDYWDWLDAQVRRRGLEGKLARWPGGDEWSPSLGGLCAVNPNPDELTPDAWTTEMALRLIRAAVKAKRPFFVHASYVPPHPPYAPVRAYRELYRAEDMVLPRSWYEGSVPSSEDYSEEEFKLLLAHYFAFVTQVDHHIGVLLEGLEELGCAQDTLVIMTSDHGDMMSEFRTLSKGRTEEGSIGVPLIVRYPRRWAGGRVVDAPVSLIDLLPTILDVAGGEVPDFLPGHSLAPLLDGVDTGPAPPVHVVDARKHPVGLCVVEGDWKLTGGKGRPKLVDLRADPDELVNRIDDPEAAAVRERLEGLLARFWSEQAGFVPEEIPRPADERD